MATESQSNTGKASQPPGPPDDNVVTTTLALTPTEQVAMAQAQQTWATAREAFAAAMAKARNDYDTTVDQAVQTNMTDQVALASADAANKVADVSVNEAFAEMERTFGVLSADGEKTKMQTNKLSTAWKNAMSTVQVAQAARSKAEKSNAAATEAQMNVDVAQKGTHEYSELEKAAKEAETKAATDTNTARENAKSAEIAQLDYQRALAATNDDAAAAATQAQTAASAASALDTALSNATSTASALEAAQKTEAASKLAIGTAKENAKIARSVAEAEALVAFKEAEKTYDKTKSDIPFN